MMVPYQAAGRGTRQSEADQLLLWYRQNWEEGRFDGAAGVPIRYGLRPGSFRGGSLVICSGRTEFVEKYLEFARDVNGKEMSVWLYDQCGQGKSGRLLADPEKGHIDDFQTYRADLAWLLEHRVRPATEGAVVLLGHSMGGTIAVLQTARQPGLIDGLILSSPMLQINTGRLLLPVVVETLSGLLCRLGRAGRYAWGTGPFDYQAPWQGNPLTSERERFLLNLELVRREPVLAIGGPSFGWLRQAYRAMRQARSLAPEITCPTLMLRGTEDRVVSRSAIGKFAQGLAFCRLVDLEGSRHEPLMECDRIRNRAIKEIRQFLQVVRHR